MIVMKAGIPSVGSSNLMSTTDFIIRYPTKIKAGAVAADGMRKNNGLRKSETRKRIPVVTEARPVRAPAATPEEDSTNDVTVEVPRQAPTAVPTASAKRAPLTF